METYKFKTSINCGSCVRAITPHLNNLDGVEDWSVDTNSPDKILEVKADSLDSSTIRNIVEKAGFKAEPIA